MLDLGAWMTVQSKVEIYHSRNIKQHYTIDRSVKKGWHNEEEQKLTKICERFLKVLDTIIQDQGVNDLVESNRGLTGVPEENDSSGYESKEKQ